MILSKIIIKNYRSITDAEIDIDGDMTLIVGRNNTGKTSLFDFIEKVLTGNDLSYDDYPLNKRNELHNLLLEFESENISYTELCERIPLPSIEFWVDYSLDEPDANLGALAPFIIDIDVDTTIAIICAELRVRMTEDALLNIIGSTLTVTDDDRISYEELRSFWDSNFNKIFEMVIYAVNPKDREDTQTKSSKQLSELFPFYLIPAERVLGEDGTQKNSSLSKLITNFFDMKEDDYDPDVTIKVKQLRDIVEDANKKVQKQSDELLSYVVNSAIGFGYPNGEELQLGVTTNLKIDDQIKNQTKLSYKSDEGYETLPSSHNGLGYKNLIKMEFLLATFAKEIEKNGAACIPLLFIEEPESHMHPQMQQTFANYLETFLDNISSVHIQTFLTSHSAHIANTFDFSKIRYAQKSLNGIEYKNLHFFAKENQGNLDFIKKYLTISRCDLFFADKVILVEGASERLLLPDMIAKCDEEGIFNSQKYKLTCQYYAIIEIGGAYAYKFIPFIDFLGIPCLIITDIDPVGNDGTKSYVYNGAFTSNVTLKRWMRWIENTEDGDDTEPIRLQNIIALSDEEKTRGRCHVAFQKEENGLCGRSLEEAIRNVNREYYKLDEDIAEEALKFSGKSKTDFAIELICDNGNYIVPRYIKDGLVWLNDQKVLV